MKGDCLRSRPSYVQLMYNFGQFLFDFKNRYPDTHFCKLAEDRAVETASKQTKPASAGLISSVGANGIRPINLIFVCVGANGIRPINRP
ncbi:MAG: hypothetical protein RLZZ338_2187, partial [Cyanobacteriota bacterium]